MASVDGYHQRQGMAAGSKVQRFKGWQDFERNSDIGV
jgi:hypothetical protein